MNSFGPQEGPTLKQAGKSCILWEGPHVAGGEQCGEEEKKLNGLITTPTPYPTEPLREKVEEPGMKEGS